MYGKYWYCLKIKVMYENFKDCMEMYGNLWNWNISYENVECWCLIKFRKK
jgi:hypothetical protein